MTPSQIRSILIDVGHMVKWDLQAIQDRGKTSRRDVTVLDQNTMQKRSQMPDGLREAVRFMEAHK